VDSKVSGFAGRIHPMRVGERRIQKEKYTDSKIQNREAANFDGYALNLGGE